jgi:hypothetical protein
LTNESVPVAPEFPTIPFRSLFCQSQNTAMKKLPLNFGALKQRFRDAEQCNPRVHT